MEFGRVTTDTAPRALRGVDQRAATNCDNEAAKQQLNDCNDSCNNNNDTSGVRTLRLTLRRAHRAPLLESIRGRTPGVLASDGTAPSFLCRTASKSSSVSERIGVVLPFAPLLPPPSARFALHALQRLGSFF